MATLGFQGSLNLDNALTANAKLDMKKLLGKSTARDKVRYAVRNGKLKRLPCEKCGTEKAEAHHTDYSQPLKVMWLCRTHHQEWHDNNETPEGGKGGYEALMVERETRQKFKEIKPENKTNTELLIEMIRMYEYNVKKYPFKGSLTSTLMETL